MGVKRGDDDCSESPGYITHARIIIHGARETKTRLSSGEHVS